MSVVTRNALPVGFIGLIGLFVALGAPNFLTLPNLRDVSRLSAPIMVAAIPMAFLLIMGHVDLSIGSNVALSAVTMGLLITKAGAPPWLGILAGVGTGTLAGVVNGVLVVTVGLSPIVVTLGTLAAMRGIAMWLGPFPIFGFGDFTSISFTGFLGIPYYAMVAAGVALIGGYVLGFSPTGRHTLAIGVNEQAAFLSGIPVRRTIFGGYVIIGLAAGVAGVMFAMLLNSAPSGTLGILFELEVLTAVMLGGVAFSGGKGTIRGVVIGVLFLAILQNGLILLNVQSSVASIVRGGALILAAWLDRATVRAIAAR